MCVRALNGSIVNLLNVNFPCGWWNPSSVIYDTSSGESNPLCSRLFIWNIADRSQLKASLISVSGLFPADAGYHGPSGDWGISGLPNITSHTGALSVLDYFGKSLKNPLGKTTQQNYGPFRLYFSVNPAVNVLTNINDINYGAIPQVYAQGYQPSSYMMTSGSVSSLYPMLLHVSGCPYHYGLPLSNFDVANLGSLEQNLTLVSANLVPSGYYYGTHMMANDGFIAANLDRCCR